MCKIYLQSSLLSRTYLLSSGGLTIPTVRLPIKATNCGIKPLSGANDLTVLERRSVTIQSINDSNLPYETCMTPIACWCWDAVKKPVKQTRLHLPIATTFSHSTWKALSNLSASYPYCSINCEKLLSLKPVVRPWRSYKWVELSKRQKSFQGLAMYGHEVLMSLQTQAKFLRTHSTTSVTMSVIGNFNMTWYIVVLDFLFRTCSHWWSSEVAVATCCVFVDES
jgi:hypothetical protein